MVKWYHLLKSHDAIPAEESKEESTSDAALSSRILRQRNNSFKTYILPEDHSFLDSKCQATKGKG